MALGKAYIEVHADTKPFGRELRTDLEKYLAAADKQMAKGGAKSGKSFSSGFKQEYRNGIRDIEKEGVKLERTVRNAGRKAGQGLRNEFRRGTKDVERDVARLGTGISNTILSFTSSSLKNLQDWGNALTGLVAGGVSNISTSVYVVAGLVLLISALITAAIPLIASLGAALGLLAAVGASLALAFGPFLLIFKELAPLMSKFGESTSKWAKDIKTVNPIIRPVAEALRDIALTLKSLPIGLFAEALVEPLKRLNTFLKSSGIREAIKFIGTDVYIFVQQLTKAFQSTTAAQAFAKWITTIGQVLTVLGPAFANVINAFMVVFNNAGFQAAVVTIATMVATIADKFAAWLISAANSGALTQFLNDALMIFQDILNILTLVGPLIAAFTTPAMMQALHGFLVTFQALLVQMTVFFSSKAGQQFLQDLIRLLTISLYLMGGFIATLGIMDYTLHVIWKTIKIVGGAFVTAWNAVKSAWNGAPGFFSNIWTIIKSIFGKSINKVIDLINGLISAWNAIPFAINIHKIPHIGTGGGGGGNTASNLAAGALNAAGGGGGGGGGGGNRGLYASANGNYFDSPALTMIGEGNRPEVVIPLSKPGRARELADKTGLTRMLTGDRGWGDIYVFVGNEPVDARVERAMGHAAYSLSTGPRG